MRAICYARAIFRAEEKRTRARGCVMVWGMEVPSTFGDFWPSGGYEGDDRAWSDRLDRYFYDGEILPEKKAFLQGGLSEASLNYSIFVSKKLISEPGAREDGRGPPFIPVEPHEVPQFFQTEKSHTSLGSLIALNFGILAVDEDMKAVIERLEPGVHQFFPIEIRMPKEKTYPKPYYILLIGQYIDGFLPAASKDGSYKSYPGYPNYFTLVRRPSSAMSGLAMSKAAIGKAHLWRERGLNGALTCLSDELKAEVNAAGLRLPKHHKMMEV